MIDLKLSDVVGDGVDVIDVCMFSVDGFYTVECTFVDLRFVESCLYVYGVIILDDCFNFDWFGCISGFG